MATMYITFESKENFKQSLMTYDILAKIVVTSFLKFSALFCTSMDRFRFIFVKHKCNEWKKTQLLKY